MNANQRMLLTGLTPDKLYSLSVRYSGFGGDKVEPFPLEAQADNAVIEEGATQSFNWGQKDMLWRIVFKPTAAKCEIRLLHHVDKRTYLSAESYTLEERAP